MFQGMKYGRFLNQNIEINYVAGGAGPAVLLLHGFPQTHAMWGFIAPLLAKKYTVVAADLRGYGDSSKPQCLPDCSNYTFRVMAQDQLNLMIHLGFERFHIIGHDRGARTAHRLTLDHASHVLSLSLLDIIPTYTMVMETNYQVAKAYWHWYFLAQPQPFPEHIIGLDPKYFYESCLIGWGKVPLNEFHSEQLNEYRRAWQDPAFVHATCSDYRATLALDVKDDALNLENKIKSSTLVFWGTKGLMHQLFDMREQWNKRLENPEFATLDGGHFFPDQFPKQTAQKLLSFLDHVEERA
ncbi:MAG: alpha/beta fold hydrolase [Hyphomicrobium sp.]